MKEYVLEDIKIRGVIQLILILICAAKKTSLHIK